MFSPKRKLARKFPAPNTGLAKVGALVVIDTNENSIAGKQVARQLTGVDRS